MKSKTTKKIIRDIAKEENLPEWVIEKIVKFQFYAVEKILAVGTPGCPETFFKVMLPEFGMWKPKDWLIEKGRILKPGVDYYCKDQPKKEESKLSDEERYFTEL